MTTNADLAIRAEEPRQTNGQPSVRNHRRHLASWTKNDWNRAVCLAMAITALGAATDAIFAGEILKMFTGDTFLGYLAAVGAVTVASACAFFAGCVIHHGANKNWRWVLMGIWAGIGIGLVAMRIMHSQIKVPDTENAPPEEIDRILLTAFLGDLGMGVLMFVIFLATGMLLIHKAKDLADPDLRRMLKGRSARARLLKLWPHAAAQAVLHGNLLARRIRHIGTTLEQERLNAHDGVLAGRELNKETSRVAQAEIIGDPSATLMTRLRPEASPYRSNVNARTDTSGIENAPGNTGTESPASPEDKK